MFAPSLTMDRSDNAVIPLLGAAFGSVVTLNYAIPAILPAIADDFGIGIEAAGSVVSIYGLWYALCALLLGPASDHFGRKRVMVVSLAAVGIACLLCGQSFSFPFLLLARSLGGLVAAILQPATWAYVGDYFPRSRRGSGSAWVVNAASLSMIVGLLGAGLLTEHLSWRWVFNGTAVVAFVTCLSVLARLPRIGPSRTQPWKEFSARRFVSTVGQDLGGLMRETRARSALLVSFTIWFAYFGVYTYWGAFLNQQFGLGSGRIGFVTVTVAVGYIIGSQLGGRLSDRIGRGKVIRAGLVVLGGLLAFLPWIGTLTVAVVGTLVLAAGFHFTYSAQLALASELVPKARSTAMSINYFFTYLGMMSGSAVAGLVLGQFGYRAVGLTSACACWGAAVLVHWLVRRPVTGGGSMSERGGSE